MAVYLLAVLLAGLFCVLGIRWIISIEEKIVDRDAMERLTAPADAPQGEIKAQAGDFSALEDGSIEGRCFYG